MRDDRFDLPLRILVADPVPGLALTLQRGPTGKAALIPAAASSPGAVAFDLEVTVNGALPDGRPRFLGPYVQGPPAERFVYICVAQDGAGPIGRMKVPLGELGWTLIEGLPPGGRIEGRVSGRGRKGGPALATVPILEPGWAYIPG
jgi:hypothetical protein